jgi:hypothetical protein
MACVIETVPAIPGEPGTGLTQAQAVDAIAQQRTAAMSNFMCKQDFATWYLDLQKSINDAAQ